MTMARALLHLDSAIRFAPAGYPRRWIILGAVAVGGSLLYGASVAVVLPNWSLLGAALWLALSAGLAWCVFIPALWMATKLPLWRCLDSSLITMAAGEVVLINGALANVILWQQGIVAHAALINLAVVGISNVTMAAMLAFQLHAWRIPLARTVALWMLVLNGSGAVFFLTLHPWLCGR